MNKSFLLASVFAATLAIQVLPGHALTVGFDGANVDPYIENGFQFDIARIVNGNCNVKPCMALNTNETSILTRVGGGVFSLSSFWFQILGKPATLTVKSYSGVNLLETVALTEAVYPHNNGGQVFTHLFDNITSISFHDSGKGNLRIDDLTVSTPTVNSVPLPAAFPLLMAGLAAMGFVGRRRKNQLSA